MNKIAEATTRRSRRSAFGGPAARPAAVIRQRRVQLGFDSDIGDYRLTLV